jgi:HK97 family phage prohead protease
MSRAMEMRSVPVEFRMDEEGQIQGTGVPYGVWSEDLGGFRERFLPGALGQSVAADDVRCIFNHDSNYVLGRKSSGTLTLREDDNGLHYSATPPDTQWARDLQVSIRRGDIRENSFGFWVDGRDGEQWEERDGMYWRTVKRARIRELGPQTFPAYPQSTVMVRTVGEVLASAEEILGAVREAAVAVEDEVVVEATGRHPSVLALETEMDHEGE